MVKDEPYIILGGELGNSSATTMTYMESIWPKLKAMNLNTVLMPVYWELIEKKEGTFDFSLLENLITEARKQDIKIVFLWFASWKNSMSTHIPHWVKLNQKKYPRAQDENGISQEILTPFSENNLNADLKAFTKFMTFLKAFDGNAHTTIMVQVENEIGMLPSARDYHPLANAAFKRDVPEKLMDYIIKNKKNLVPEFLEIWSKNGSKTSGNWEAIFGRGLHTDEIFMAWYFAQYTEAIAKAGKAVYELPLFVNAALNSSKKIPGNYPSAGPLPHILDVWKAAGNHIDLYAPDFYNPDFKHWNDLYTRQDNPLFIPEHKFDDTAAAKALYAIGHYNAIGFSPFSIESTTSASEEPLGKMYHIINQLSPWITNPSIIKHMDAVLLSKENPETKINMGDFQFTLRHDLTLNWSPKAKEEHWPTTSVVIIEDQNGYFYIGGTGAVVTITSAHKTPLQTGILSAEEGTFNNSNWQVIRHLNGDQTHQGRHIRIPFERYAIQKFSLYTYK